MSIRSVYLIEVLTGKPIEKVVIIRCRDCHETFEDFEYMMYCSKCMRNFHAHDSNVKIGNWIAVKI